MSPLRASPSRAAAAIASGIGGGRGVAGVDDVAGDDDVLGQPAAP